MNMSECPICSQSFPANELAQHASECLDDDQIKIGTLMLGGMSLESAEQKLHNPSIDLSSSTELTEERQARLGLTHKPVCVTVAYSNLDTAAKQHHFQICQQEFERLVDHPGGSRYRVYQVEVIINPTLRQRYNDHKEQLSKQGHPTNEYLAWHGTDQVAIRAIAQEGFKVGGVDVSCVSGSNHGQGIYTSEHPNFAMSYARDGGKRLLLSRVCPCPLAANIHSVDSSHIQQLVVRQSAHILPVYIVHFKLE